VEQAQKSGGRLRPRQVVLVFPSAVSVSDGAGACDVQSITQKTFVVYFWPKNMYNLI
jgi:hypothetical protein